MKERKKGFVIFKLLSIEQPNLRTPTFQKFSYLGDQKRKWKKEWKLWLTQHLHVFLCSIVSMLSLVYTSPTFSSFSPNTINKSLYPNHSSSNTINLHPLVKMLFTVSLTTWATREYTLPLENFSNGRLVGIVMNVNYTILYEWQRRNLIINTVVTH